MANCTLQLETNFELNITTNCSDLQNNTEPIKLPNGVEAFTPFFLCLLIVTVACNITLMALILKACKVNNSINIYLFWLSVGGLLQSLSIVLLVGVTITRIWVFGPAMCIINKYVLLVTNSLLQILHLIISRDRYKAIKNPLTSHKKTKQAYKYSAVLWIVMCSLGLVILIGDIRNPPNPGVDGDTFICFGLSNKLSEFNILFRVLSVLTSLILVAVVAFVTLAHYICIIRELRAVEKHRANFKTSQTSPLATQVLQVNGRDKPLYTTAEERTAKSLTVIYLLQFICTGITNISGFVLVILYSATDFALSPEGINSFNSCILLLLAVYFIPTANPAILVFANKKFRQRVIGLLKCELNPHIETDVQPVLKDDIVTRSSSSLKQGSTLNIKDMFISGSR